MLSSGIEYRSKSFHEMLSPGLHYLSLVIIFVVNLCHYGCQVDGFLCRELRFGFMISSKVLTFIQTFSYELLIDSKDLCRYIKVI